VGTTRRDANRPGYVKLKPIVVPARKSVTDQRAWAGPRRERRKDAGARRPEAYAAYARLRTSRGWGPAVRGARSRSEARRRPRTPRDDGYRPGYVKLKPIVVPARKSVTDQRAWAGPRRERRKDAGARRPEAYAAYVEDRRVPRTTRRDADRPGYVKLKPIVRQW
jgi:hypothetical protein